jgi:hypothetical protein
MRKTEINEDLISWLDILLTWSIRNNKLANSDSVMKTSSKDVEREY